MAGIKLPNIIKNFNVIVGGVGFAGVADEVELPKLARKLEEYIAAGMDTPIDIDMGGEKMESSLALTGMGDMLLASFGNCSVDGVRLTLKAVAQSDTAGCDFIPVVIKLRGRIKEFDQGTIKKGEKNSTKVALSVSYYQYMSDGKVLFERDILKNTMVVNGVNTLAKENKFLGL